jgi:predicted glycoside hydrolase/deacetylase ChbG (UPF0249 family)
MAPIQEASARSRCAASASSDNASGISPKKAGLVAAEPGAAPRHFGLIVNADDWGRDQSNTDCIYRCIQAGSVTAVSAMVFMEDSVRAASMAQTCGIDAGLHLNFTTGFSSPAFNPGLLKQQQRLTDGLRSYRFSPLVFHPFLQDSFEYVVRSQVDEFARLYGRPPNRIDGHHHMHLCANLLFSRHLLPRGIAMRRNFTFHKGEKSLVNRLYRRFVDAQLRKRYRLTDHLFSILPMLPQRLDRIFAIACRSFVELETHPVNPEEYRYLSSDQFAEKTDGILLRRGFAEIAAFHDSSDA